MRISKKKTVLFAMMLLCAITFHKVAIDYTVDSITCMNYNNCRTPPYPVPTGSQYMPAS